MQVRLATEKDLPAMVDLWWEMQSSHDPYDSRFYRTIPESECRELARIYFEKSLGEEQHLILVAEESGRPVGMLHLEIRENPPVLATRRLAHIVEAAVAASQRNRGVFRALFLQARDRMRQEGVERIEAHVDAVNPAVRAYERLGFLARQQVMVAWI